jgi:hypothetical protein
MLSLKGGGCVWPVGPCARHQRARTGTQRYAVCRGNGGEGAQHSAGQVRRATVRADVLFYPLFPLPRYSSELMEAIAGAQVPPQIHLSPFSLSFFPSHFHPFLCDNAMQYPTFWATLPASIKAEALRKAARDAPQTITAMMRDIQLNIRKVFDLKHMVVEGMCLGVVRGSDVVVATDHQCVRWRWR